MPRLYAALRLAEATHSKRETGVSGWTQPVAQNSSCTRAFPPEKQHWRDEKTGAGDSDWLLTDRQFVSSV